MRLKKKYNIATFLMMVVLVIVILSFLSAYLAPKVIIEDFKQNTAEGDIGEWFINVDAPQDPNNPGHTVQWHIRRVSNISHSGVHSVELFINGK